MEGRESLRKGKQKEGRKKEAGKGKGSTSD